MVVFLGWPEYVHIAILVLCILVAYSENILEVGGFYKKDERQLRHVRREMKSAIVNVNLADLRQLLMTNVTEKMCETLNNEQQNPYYMLTQMKEDVTTEAELIMLLVFHFFSKLNGDGSYFYHPLTSAYRNHRYRLAERILTRLESDAFTEVVKEVYASMLSCESIAHVDESVTLIVDETETRDCVVHYASKLQLYNQSELQTVYMNHYPSKRQRKPSKWVLWILSFWETERIIAPPSTLRSKMWFSPFAPIYSFEILPPRHLVVMNPSVFHDFVDATWYYFVGSILPINAIATHAIILASMLSLLILLWGKHVIQCFLPDITRWVNHFLHNTIDNTGDEQTDAVNTNSPISTPVNVANTATDDTATDNNDDNDNDNSMDGCHDVDDSENRQHCNNRQDIKACERACKEASLVKRLIM